MSRAETRPHRLLNVALVLLGLLTLVLLYALVTRAFTPRVDPGREDNPAHLVGEIIQVEVRNACGIDGLAAETTRYLRRRGFDVVEVGDHTSFDLEHSLVVDRVGDPAAAQKVANALGISADYIVQDINLDYYLDASVLIGKDYASLTPFSSNEDS
ncbi:MAG: LytR family transcriptional regulator [Bacteroidetes bacterium]|nr:hypothetical protein AWN76_016490 [Rhodothermaceae bacterium RA]RMH58540.1 MAG: LytR family transcriptional regulator [Bacteroidota bacterium]